MIFSRKQKRHFKVCSTNIQIKLDHVNPKVFQFMSCPYIASYYSIPPMDILSDPHPQKYSRVRCFLRVKGLGICFYLGWSGSIPQIRTNIKKVGSKSWLLTCSSNITLSLPSYTVSALQRELNFCNGCLSLLYFCTSPILMPDPISIVWYNLSQCTYEATKPTFKIS